MITICRYDHSKKELFRTLNEEWLRKYFTLEPLDVMLLSDPQHSIIDPGGEIFFAEQDGAVVGTAALIRHSEEEFELGKMAVTEAAQGLGIGALLMERCIAAAKDAAAVRIILYSNTMLVPAIRLYRKFGFTETPLTESGYVRTNIKMELLLK